MKKLLLSVCACLMGLSVQASQEVDWRTEQSPGLVEQAVRGYFQEARQAITRQDIRDAMKRFPEFLQWTYPAVEDAFIVHLVARFADNASVLRYLLGFSPDLTIVDGSGRTPEDMCHNQELKKVFEEYRHNPWRHPDNVLELPVDHELYIYDSRRFGEQEL